MNTVLLLLVLCQPNAPQPKWKEALPPHVRSMDSKAYYEWAVQENQRAADVAATRSQELSVGGIDVGITEFKGNFSPALNGGRGNQPFWNENHSTTRSWVQRYPNKQAVPLTVINPFCAP